MAREFKPVRFFVMMAIAAFIVCGVTAFYTKRAEHGRTAEERQGYWIGEKAGEQAPRDAKLPTPAELNMMAQKYFKQQGSGDQVRIGIWRSNTGTKTGSIRRIRSELVCFASSGNAQLRKCSRASAQRPTSNVQAREEAALQCSCGYRR